MPIKHYPAIRDFAIVILAELMLYICTGNHLETMFFLSCEPLNRKNDLLYRVNYSSLLSKSSAKLNYKTSLVITGKNTRILLLFG